MVKYILTSLLLLVIVQSQAQSAKYVVTNKPNYVGAPWDIELRVYHENKLDEIPECFSLPQQSDDWEHIEVVSTEKSNNGEYYTIQKLKGFSKIGVNSIKLPSSKLDVMIKGAKIQSSNPLISSSVYDKPTSKKIDVLGGLVNANLKDVKNAIFGNVKIEVSENEIVNSGIPFYFSVTFSGDISQNRITAPKLILINTEIFALQKITKKGALEFHYTLSLVDNTKDGVIKVPSYYLLAKGKELKNRPINIITTSLSPISTNTQNSSSFSTKSNYLRSTDFLFLLAAFSGYFFFFYKGSEILLSTKKKLSLWIQKTALKLSILILGRPNKKQLNKLITLGYGDINHIKLYYEYCYGTRANFERKEYWDLINTFRVSQAAVCAT